MICRLLSCGEVPCLLDLRYATSMNIATVIYPTGLKRVLRINMSKCVCTCGCLRTRLSGHLSRLRDTSIISWRWAYERYMRSDLLIK